MNDDSGFDHPYLEVLLKRIRICGQYKPKFGQGNALSLAQFSDLYGSDPFYTWLGLDNPLMYAAHRTAGGITSVYRQIGIGCEELFRNILRDHLALTDVQTQWAYGLPKSGGDSGTRKLSLDGRVAVTDIALAQKRTTFVNWLREAARVANVDPEVAEILKGAVFEVRQGYKSKDSKRQNADIANASAAYSQGYLPVVLILSAQIDNDLVSRYRAQHWLILRGYLEGSATHSTYTFIREVVGYNLGAFFERNKAALKSTVLGVLEVLLKADE